MPPDSFSGNISGTGNLTLNGGTETLTGANAFTGVTTVAGGTLVLSGAGSIASSELLIDDSVVDISATNAGASVGSLNGTGSLVLGSQNLTLSKTSGTFSGTFSGSGSLIIASGTQTLSTATGTVAIPIVNNGALVLAGGQTFAGVISGSGSLTSANGGVISLTAPNTYTGVTTIATGTLALAGAGGIAASSAVVDDGTLDISGTTSGAAIVSLSGTGGITLGSQTLTLTNASSVFAGSLSGAGGLALSGGTETLSGASNYQGGTLISGGILQLGTGGALGSVTGAITDNGTLVLDYGGGVTVNNTISGSGSLQQSGVRTTTLTGSNSYSGGTAINSGTLQIGDGGADGAITGAVSDNGELAFDRPDAVTFAGVISGPGAVTQAGTGSVTLTAASSYTGATTIAAGTLALAGAGSIAASSSDVDNGTFDISATPGASIISLSGSGAVNLGAETLTLTNAADIFAGVISGTGGLTLESGTETLENTISYAGPTTINAGTLILSNTGQQLRLHRR